MESHLMKSTQQTFFSQETGSIHIDNNCIHFRMRKNRRIKQGRLIISPEEGLVVETPDKVTIRGAQKMITKKKKWVLDTLGGIQKKRKLVTEVKKFKDSALIYGQEKIVEAKKEQPKNYIFETKSKIILGFIQQSLAEGVVNDKLKQWLKAKAQRYIPLRVRQLNQNRFQINKVLIKDQQTLWGSCSSENNLNINWRIIMAPPFAGDYIIFHELCHTRYLDHSQKYWKLVGQVCPYYKKAEKWFHDYGFILHINFDGL